MVLPRQTTTPKNAHLEPKGSPVFLRQNISGRLAGAEQTVLRAIDPAILAHSLVVFRPRIIPACRQFLQWQFIWRVAINFVGGQENEYGLGIRAARGFEQIQGAYGIYL